MGRTLTVLGLLLPTILIGFGIPALSLYYLSHGWVESLVAGVISCFAIIFAFILGVVTIEEGVKHSPLEALSESDKERLNLLRVHQRATLEELDDITALLLEIRDVLKSVEKA